MSITKKDVEHVVKLARLALSEEQKEKFTRELGAILDYVAKLNEADTKGVDFAPQAHPPRAENLRQDIAEDSKIQEAILEQAPKKKQRFFEVKGIFEE